MTTISIYDIRAYCMSCSLFLYYYFILAKANKTSLVTAVCICAGYSLTFGETGDTPVQGVKGDRGQKHQYCNLPCNHPCHPGTAPHLNHNLMRRKQKTIRSSPMSPHHCTASQSQPAENKTNKNNQVTTQVTRHCTASQSQPAENETIKKIRSPRHCTAS